MRYCTAKKSFVFAALDVVPSSLICCRCAVIVNDMAELNIDATLVKNDSLIQAGEL